MSIGNQSLSEAWSRMQDALESVTEAIREHGSIDPRYFNERAVLKLWMIEFGRSPEAAQYKFEPPYDPAEIAEELHRAVSLASGKLKIHMLNSLCYSYLLSGSTARMSQTLEELRNALGNTYPDRSKWPAFALDTVVYTTYLLKHDTELTQLKSWYDELTASLDQSNVSSQERRLIVSHANEIAEFERSRRFSVHV
jgi:hypothetical protein